MRVLVRPCYSFFLQNKLFSLEHEYAPYWMEPMVRLYEEARSQGIELATWDMYPLDSADIVFFQDLPPTRREVEQARKTAPNARFILQLVESPQGRPHWFQKQNHSLFDAVLTYNYRLCDSPKYFHYNLPIGIPPRPDEVVPFSERRPLVLINNNRMAGMLSTRQSGWEGLPFLGPKLGGWHVPLRSLITQSWTELYSHRRRIARLAEQKFPDLLDIYGYGWQGEPISWSHKILRHQPYKCARGNHKPGAKLQVLGKYRFCVAFENIRTDVGYISEKILDAFYAGSVPIYLGDESITKTVPEDCFVDARKFSTDYDLLQYVRDCSEEEWTVRYKAGQEFLDSELMKGFQPNAFAGRVLEAIKQIANPEPSSAHRQLSVAS